MELSLQLRSSICPGAVQQLSQIRDAATVHGARGWMTGGRRETRTQLLLFHLTGSCGSTTPTLCGNYGNHGNWRVSIGVVVVVHLWTG